MGWTPRYNKAYDGLQKGREKEYCEIAERENKPKTLECISLPMEMIEAEAADSSLSQDNHPVFYSHQQRESGTP